MAVYGGTNHAEECQLCSVCICSKKYDLSVMFLTSSAMVVSGVEGGGKSSSSHLPEVITRLTSAERLLGLLHVRQLLHKLLQL